MCHNNEESNFHTFPRSNSNKGYRAIVPWGLREQGASIDRILNGGLKFSSRAFAIRKGLKAIAQGFIALIVLLLSKQ